MLDFPPPTSGTPSGGGHYGESKVEVVRFDSPFLPQKSPAEGLGASPVRSALVVLNTPIAQPPSPVFQQLWEISSLRVCADGGANRLYDATAVGAGAGGEKETRRGDDAGDEGPWVPDLIRGDLDSLRPDVRSRYEALGCRVECVPDQDSNDLDKALRAVLDELGCPLSRGGGDTNVDTEGGIQPTNVLVYGAFGGRFDQEMASLQALYKWAGKFHHRMILYSDETCAFLLPANVRNEIRLPLVTSQLENEEERGRLTVGEGRTCGIIPLGEKCESVLTTGLQWNLDGTAALEFGGLVSTSNRIIDDVVTVQASRPLIFTAEVVQ